MFPSVLEIIASINSYIVKNGGEYRSWYVGVASDARRRLFDEHGVSESNDLWIFWPCASSLTARSIEQYFIQRLGTDGGPGGGNEMSRTVYAFKKNPHPLSVRRVSNGMRVAVKKSLGVRPAKVKVGIFRRGIN